MNPIITKNLFVALKLPEDPAFRTGSHVFLIQIFFHEKNM